MAASRVRGAANGARSRLRKAVPPAPLSDEELTNEVRHVMREASWLSAAELKKRLPKSRAADGLAVARELSAAGELWCYEKGRAAHFFTEDPISTLERRVPELLRRKALSLGDLTIELDRAAPGVGQVLPEWLKGALARRQVFVHTSKAPGSKKPPEKAKTYSTRPDLKTLLEKSLAALGAELKATDAANVSRDEVLQFLAVRLGACSAAGFVTIAESADASVLREAFLSALRRIAAENGKGALLSVRQVRGEARLDKDAFDTTALVLSREGAIVLHHHDHAASLSDLERSQLIRDDSGTHYVGIALRRPS